jgi:hypothetical protein
MDQAYRQQHRQPAQQQVEPLSTGKPLELDREPDPEQKRKQDAVSVEEGPASGRNCSKIETRNSVTALMASTMNSAIPRSTSIATVRSAALAGIAGDPCIRGQNAFSIHSIGQ